MAVAARPAGPRAALGDVRALPRPVVLGLALVLIAAAYAVLGIAVTAQLHVVPPESLDRLARAVLIWHGDPATLAAIGFHAPPLPTLALLPLALFGAAARSLVALPVTSAVFAAVALLALERTLALCRVELVPRGALVAAFGLNPLFAYWASNGAGEALELALLALALRGLVGWAVSSRPRDLAGCALAFAGLVLTRYAFAWWALLVALAVAATLARRRAGSLELEGSVLAFAAPATYALAVWTLLGALVAGSAFGWASFASDAAPGAAVGDVLGRLLDLAAGGFPLAFVVVPALALVAVARADVLAPWLAGLVVLGVAIAVVQALGADDLGPLELRHALPLELTALVGAGWLARNAGPGRPDVVAVTFVVLAFAVAGSWRAMERYPVQAGELAFTRALRTGNDQGRRVRFLPLSTTPGSTDLVARRWRTARPPGATVAFAAGDELLLRLPAH